MIRLSVLYPATEGAFGHDSFDSVEALHAAMAAPGTGDVIADVANDTTIMPVMQTSEIVG